MNKSVVSVITIAFNEKDNIGYTLSSVKEQSYDGIEYIIVDGGSTDGTLEVIKEYSAVVDVLISEKDAGIYDAMNKGLRRATGDYVIFMNAGDEFYDRYTVETVLKNGDNADIIFGETKLIDASRKVIGDRKLQAPKIFTWKSFRFGMSICHQAIYIKRSILSDYDLSYKLSSDIDWVIKAAKNAATTKHCGQYVAKYLVGGVSDQRNWESLKERYQILKKHYGFFPNILAHMYIVLRFILLRLRG